MIAPDPDNPLSQLTHRELLANRAKARRRKNAAALRLVMRIEAELDRRRALKADRMFGELPKIAALDN